MIVTSTFRRNKQDKLMQTNFTLISLTSNQQMTNLNNAKLVALKSLAICSLTNKKTKVEVNFDLFSQNASGEEPHWAPGGLSNGLIRLSLAARRAWQSSKARSRLAFCLSSSLRSSRISRRISLSVRSTPSKAKRRSSGVRASSNIILK